MVDTHGMLELMRGAVAAAPDNHALRLKLAEMLLASGNAAEALAACTAVLEKIPDHREALGVAEQAALAVGDGRAAGYARLRQALATPETPPAPPSRGLDAGGGTDAAPADAPEPEPAVETPIVPLSLVRSREPRQFGADDERPEVTLAEVGGMEKVKARLNAAFLAPLANPALRAAFRKSLRGGLLLYGPPGCGKTFIARAVAGELGARFIAISLHDVLDMYIGQGEKNLHAIFENARRSAPCVVFFDEVDAIGRKRTQLASSSGRGIVVQLLSELDSFGSDNEGVFVMGATNHPWDVDTALRRPGRFDRTLLVPPPDEAARAAILAYHMRGRPQEEGLDVGALARVTKLWSGADLAHLCETGAERALEASIALGAPRPITMDDLRAAMAELKPSTTAWLENARNYAQFANEGGAYDDLLAYFREGQT
jgi:AAA+ superfamily predicted ATPase